MTGKPVGESRLLWTVALVAIVLSTLLAVRLLVVFSWDPTIFVSFGEDHVEITEYGESVLGREVVTRRALGHDGKYFFIQANDPLILEPEEHMAVIDRPLYRSQRMLYPLLAGGGGLFPPSVVVWALIVVNIIAMGVGSWAVARLAKDMGGSPWWGLAFVLNLGFISELLIDGAGIVAAAAAFAAILQIRWGKTAKAISLLMLAALAREAMLLVAAGSAAWLWWNGKRRTALWTAMVPGLAVAVWGLYARLRIGFDSGVSQVQEIGLPFVGIFNAFESWLQNPIDMAAGTAILLLLVLYTRRTLMSSRIVGWAFIGFVPLALLFTRQVWLNYFDITRAVAPVITSFVLLVFLPEISKDREVSVVREPSL